jgi:hypothetical protein
MRQGADLADILGIQRAVLGPEHGPEAPEERPPTAGKAGTGRPLDLAPDSDEARRLIDYGLAGLVDDKVVMTDPKIGDIVSRSSDQLLYLRALLQIYEATQDAVDGLATGFVQALDDFVASRFGSGYVPAPADTAELSRIVSDYRDLWSSVVAERLDESLQQRVSSTRSDYAAVLLGGPRAAKPARAERP